MAATHWAVPLRAYYRNKTVVRPRNYRSTLAGAIVYIEFTLEHKAVKNGDDFFDAYIRRLRVLERPPPSRQPSVECLKPEDA